jgi:hypothetical protein
VLREAGANSTLKFYEGVSHADIMLSLSTWMRNKSPSLADAVAFMRGQ